LNGKIHAWQSFFLEERRKAIGIGAVFRDVLQNQFSSKHFFPWQAGRCKVLP
jgi:hypothetical protein